jgi:signal transduction histidine kinase
MFQTTTFTVFLSSTARDLEEHRNEVYEAIQGLEGYRCARMEDFGARDSGADDFCRAKVAECDLFIGILGHIYGSCPPGCGQSYTEREYEAAVAAGVPRLVFFAPDEFRLPVGLIEPDWKRRQQHAFRERVRDERVRDTFSSPADLAKRVVRAIYNWQREGGRRSSRTSPGAEPAAAAFAPALTASRSGAGVAPNPYRGLLAFREQDAPVFFGREAFTHELERAVRDQPLVAVVGPSGSGKSSVVFAGLLPRLRPEDGWLTASLRPSDRPFHGLAAALLPLLGSDRGETEWLVETRKLGEALGRGEVALSDVMDGVLTQHSGTGRLLLVADQFEELYTLCRDPDERQRFLDRLLAPLRVEAPPFPPRLTLVLTLRADFVGHVLSYRPLADALQHADLKLGPMTRRELRDAVERPAHRLGVRIEEGLTERVLNAIGHGPGNLPLLEFALYRLWDRQRDSRLTHAAYEEIGGVERALASYAEEVYARLGPTEQGRAQQVFIQLVSPGQGTEDTRRLARRAEVREENWGLVSRLATARLVVTGRDQATDEETVEVAHEALIREWGRLRGWLEADRAFRTWQERLRAAIRQWEALGRDAGALLRGVLLAEAEGWLGRRPDGLAPAEQLFIGASRERQDQEEQRWQKLYEELREEGRARDEMVAILAHELRNPLNPICNAVRILRQHNVQDPTVCLVRDMIDRQLRQLTRVVDDLLDTSRAARGRIPLEKTPLDLTQLVRQAAEDLRGHVEENGLKLVIEVPDMPLWAPGDRVRLEQVVSHLVQSAVKFTPPGGQVTVRLGGEPGGQVAVLDVRDTGIGIRPGLLSRIFEPLAPLQRSVGLGIGLGLRGVRQLVEMHGGSMSAHSAGPHQGSEFLVRLPLLPIAGEQS